MEVILKDDVKGLGYKNDTVTVKPGYGRNYLLPQGLAVLADKTNKKIVAENVRQAAHKADKIKGDAQSIADQIGDQVLEQIGTVIRTHFREADVSGRVGGEEFAILLPDTTLRAATDIGQRFIEAIARLRAEPAHLITASMGVACAQAGHANLQYLLNSADKALYQAKALGRNQVAVAG